MSLLTVIGRDARPRESLQAAMIVVGGVAVKSRSRVQKTRALSSGEAEFYAMIGGGAKAFRFQALAADLGWLMSIILNTDSNSSKSLSSRTGLGKCRHIETKFLWLQQADRRKKILLRKVARTLNPANMLTKPQAREESDRVR